MNPDVSFILVIHVPIERITWVAVPQGLGNILAYQPRFALYFNSADDSKLWAFKELHFVHVRGLLSYMLGEVAGAYPAMRYPSI